MSNTQEKFVKKMLREIGQISRNFCLQHYISRLGVIICDLKKSGWEISGSFVKINGGKDYIYKLVKAPFVPKYVWSEEKKAMVCDNSPKQDKLL